MEGDVIRWRTDSIGILFSDKLLFIITMAIHCALFSKALHYAIVCML